jgi:hypothetical protein
VNDVGADDGAAVRTDNAGRDGAKLRHLQAACAVDQRIPKVYHPTRPAPRPSTLDDRFKLPSEPCLNLFTGTHASDRCNRSTRGIKVEAQEIRAKSNDANNRRAEAI